MLEITGREAPYRQRSLKLKGLQYVIYANELRAYIQSTARTCEPSPDGLQYLEVVLSEAWGLAQLESDYDI